MNQVAIKIEIYYIINCNNSSFLIVILSSSHLWLRNQSQFTRSCLTLWLPVINISTQKSSCSELYTRCWCTASQNCWEPSRDSQAWLLQCRGEQTVSRSSVRTQPVSWASEQSLPPASLQIFLTSFSSSSSSQNILWYPGPTYQTYQTCMYLHIHPSKPWHSGIGTQRTTYNLSIEVFVSWFWVIFNLWLLNWPCIWPHIQNITPEMDSPSWKTLIKWYYTTLHVIEIKGWTLAEILDGRERHLELWKMLNVAQGATKLHLLS